VDVCMNELSMHVWIDLYVFECMHGYIMCVQINGW